MPFYDFICQDCAESFELQLPVAQRDAGTCPRCGSTHVKRSMPHVFAVLREVSAEPGGEGCACGQEGRCCCQAGELD